MLTACNQYPSSLPFAAEQRPTHPAPRSFPQAAAKALFVLATPTEPPSQRIEQFWGLILPPPQSSSASLTAAAPPALRHVRLSVLLPFLGYRATPDEPPAWGPYVFLRSCVSYSSQPCCAWL